jgi:hypothetical protein
VLIDWLNSQPFEDLLPTGGEVCFCEKKMSWREREASDDGNKKVDRSKPLANATRMASMMEKFR